MMLVANVLDPDGRIKAAAFVHLGKKLGVPTFTPYIEIAHLDRFHFKMLNLDAGKEVRSDGTHTWQYADAEIDKLADKNVKAFFLVNPSNPPSLAVRASSIVRLLCAIWSSAQSIMRSASRVSRRAG